MREAMITSPPSSAASPVSSMSPTIRSPGIPSRRPEISSVSPISRPVARRPGGRDERVGRRVGRQRDAVDEARPADGGIDLGVDPEHEQREDALVLAWRGRDGEPALGHRSRGHDAGQRADGLHGPRAKPLVSERAQADVGSAEQIGGRALERLLGCGADDDRGGHRRHPQRDAEHGQRGPKRAREQPAPGERREAHRSLQAQGGEASDQRPRLVVAATAEGDLVADLAVADDEDPVGVRGGPRVVRHQHDRLAEPVG